jgi:hypothetical protein
MEVRELKYYKWVFEKDKVILVNKKDNTSFILTMALADSFSRACISFRNKYRIEQVIKLRELSKKTKEFYRNKLETLKERGVK